MPKIEDMRCRYCAKEHGEKTVIGLVNKSWYAEGIKGDKAKKVICPTCIENIAGKPMATRLEKRHKEQTAIQTKLFEKTRADFELE